MDIVFSADNRAEVLVLPFAPLDIGVESPQNNEIFHGLSRDINLIGTIGLRTLKISSFFPDRPMGFFHTAAPIGARAYIDFFERWRAKKVPLRVVWTDNNGEEILNMPCTIDSFSWHPASKTGRIQYDITAREYVFIVD